MAIKRKIGYVYIDSCGNPIWSTFTEDLTMYEGVLCWRRVEILDQTTTTTTSTTSTTTTSSTTTTTTTLATTTTTSTTSSTTTTSTTIPTTTTTTTTSSTTTTTTTAEPTTTTTSSTTTTTTTEATTTTTTTSTSTTSSSTTTTTTTTSMDVQFAVSFTNPDLIGTIVTAADVNAQSFNFIPDLGNGDFKGEIVVGPPTYTITLYVDTSGAGNPAFADANITIKIKDSIIGGTAIEVSPPGITGAGEITYVSSALDTTYNRIVLTEA